MERYFVKVIYPLYYTVEAETEEQAIQEALEKANKMLESSSVTPIVEEIQKI